jgi:hypothetical protein
VIRLVNTGGTERHPIDTERLMEYWARGKGAAKLPRSNGELPGTSLGARLSLAGTYLSGCLTVCAPTFYRST